MAPDDADAAAGHPAAPALVMQPATPEVTQSATACGAAQSAHDDHHAGSSADDVAAPAFTVMASPQQPVISPAATDQVAAAAAKGGSGAKGCGWMRPRRLGLVGGCVTVCAAVLAAAGALHSRRR